MTPEQILGAIFTFLGLVTPFALFFTDKIGKKIDRIVEAVVSIERQNAIFTYRIEQQDVKIEQNTTDIKSIHTKIEDVTLKVTNLEARNER